MLFKAKLGVTLLSAQAARIFKLNWLLEVLPAVLNALHVPSFEAHEALASLL